MTAKRKFETLITWFGNYGPDEYERRVLTRRLDDAGREWRIVRDDAAFEVRLEAVTQQPQPEGMPQ